jgi:hypothetical protein
LPRHQLPGLVLIPYKYESYFLVDTLPIIVTIVMGPERIERLLKKGPSIYGLPTREVRGVHVCSGNSEENAAANCKQLVGAEFSLPKMGPLTYRREVGLAETFRLHDQSQLNAGSGQVAGKLVRMLEETFDLAHNLQWCLTSNGDQECPASKWLHHSQHVAYSF